MPIKLSSEVDLLQGVITHTPGPEVSLVSPEIKDELLFDDIIFEEYARLEHQEMLNIMRTAIPDLVIHEVRDLVIEAFERPEAKQYFVNLLIKNLPGENLAPVRQPLEELSAVDLADFAICGRVEALDNISLYPSPNLLFTRDLAAVVGETIVVSKAAKKARLRESLLMDTLVTFHPMYEQARDNAIYISGEDSIEGGDILTVTDELVLIGMSERTTFSGLMHAANKLMQHGVKQVLIIDIPKKRSSMHLDTIFTFCSADECVVYPPDILERSHNVVSLTKDNESGNLQTQLKPSLKEALEEALGHSFTFMNCGGLNRTAQQREQWSDGANTFALAPGVVISYERNVHTFREMEKFGYTIISGKEFLSRYKDGGFDIKTCGKLVITFEGNELCRGRGGARCMTQPFHRIK